VHAIGTLKLSATLCTHSLPLLLLLLLLLLLQDAPACIEYVLKHSPCKADKLHWIGHSMVSSRLTPQRQSDSRHVAVLTNCMLYYSMRHARNSNAAALPAAATACVHNISAASDCSCTHLAPPYSPHQSQVQVPVSRAAATYVCQPLVCP
jgi:hypothetical protein